ncbi:hypothetical protein LR48_Vigan746s000200 [Vigna angularis]|uniref:Uncharacterized protein n=1 Tax=Phaseolus angularis TaxID=3914 RepID=A0A0L9THQ3_PHAAN|nr:hypothetical protein LR48_Vigan746s000200 [Vigna angularis]
MKSSFPLQMNVNGRQHIMEGTTMFEAKVQEEESGHMEKKSRRNVRPAVIFLLDRTEFGSELTKWNLLSEPECRTLLEVEPKPCIWEFTAIQVREA